MLQGKAAGVLVYNTSGAARFAGYDPYPRHGLHHRSQRPALRGGRHHRRYVQPQRRGDAHRAQGCRSDGHLRFGGCGRRHRRHDQVGEAGAEDDGQFQVLGRREVGVAGPPEDDGFGGALLYAEELHARGAFSGAASRIAARTGFRLGGRHLPHGRRAELLRFGIRQLGQDQLLCQPRSLQRGRNAHQYRLPPHDGPHQPFDRTGAFAAHDHARRLHQFARLQAPRRIRRSSGPTAWCRGTAPIMPTARSST